MTLLFTLLIAGYLLILAEFIVPGGILGIVGTGCLIGAAILGFIHFESSTALIFVLGELVSGAILVLIWFRCFFDSPFGKVLVHKNALKSGTAPDPPSTETLRHATGTALTPLHPSGTAILNGKRHDVVSEGKMIASGKKVTVVKIDGAHIIVRENL